MFGKISKLFLKPLVPIIRLEGDIDTRSALLVSRGLKKIKPDRSKALGLVINSNGGSPVQTELIMNKIKAYCHEHHLPLYTFAEDQAVSAGYWMLSAGDKVYADKSSTVGCIGANVSHLGVKKFFEERDIEVRTWVSDDKKIVPPMFYDVKDVHKEAMQKWTDSIRKDFIANVERFRSNKIKVPQGEREDKLYQGQAFTGQEVLNYGLVDHLGTYASVFFKDFPLCRIVDVSEKPTFEKYQQTIVELIKLLTSKALPLIIAYFVIKGTIKVYLLILVLKKKNSSDPEEVKEGEKLEKELYSS